MSFAPYLINLAIFIGIYIILAVSLNFALGFTGLINLGHIAFFGIGAYTSALLVGAGWSFLAAFLAAGIIASIAGFLLMWATRKLKGDYLALATLGFSFVVFSLFLNLDSVTRGARGITGIAKPAFFGVPVQTNAAFLLIVIIVVALTLWVLNRVTKSPFGRLMEATRDDELGARVLGKNTTKIKYKVMALSAFFAGLAGSLFAHYLSFIEPSSFYLQDIILVLTIVIVGGLASIQGTVLATILIFAINEIPRFFDLPTDVLGPVRQIIYAVLLIGILLFKPRGILGRVDIP